MGTCPSYDELLARQETSRLAFGRMLLNWRRRNSWTQYTACSWAKAIGEPSMVISYGNLSVIEQGKAGELRQRSFWQLGELNRRIAAREWGRFGDAALREKLEAAIPLGDEGSPVWEPLEFWACYCGVRPVPPAFFAAPAPVTGQQQGAGAILHKHHRIGPQLVQMKGIGQHEQRQRPAAQPLGAGQPPPQQAQAEEHH